MSDSPDRSSIHACAWPIHAAYACPCRRRRSCRPPLPIPAALPCRAFVLVDGIGDVSIPAFGNRTPLQAASVPHLDAIAGQKATPSCLPAPLPCTAAGARFHVASLGDSAIWHCTDSMPALGSSCAVLSLPEIAQYWCALLMPLLTPTLMNFSCGPVRADGPR